MNVFLSAAGTVCFCYTAHVSSGLFAPVSPGLCGAAGVSEDGAQHLHVTTLLSHASTEEIKVIVILLC